MTTPLDRVVADRVARHGPLHLDEVLDVALYDPDHGFYGAGAGAAGRRADFLTSPEVGPLFGAVIASALDRWWVELGRPDPFTVIEAAAGAGTLARAVLLAEPACATALTYVLVERSAALRARQGEHLSLTEPAFAFPPAPDEDDEDARPVDGLGQGPRLVSLPDLPVVRVSGVVLANELLDNLAFRLVERTVDGWSEVRVGAAEASTALTEVLVVSDAADAALAERLAPEAPVGARLPIQRQARAWVTDALDRLDRGRLVVIDYAATSSDLVGRPSSDWLRTYRHHERGGEPLADLGTQDVTCEVDVSQLELDRRPDANRSQAAFLAEHGIEALVAEGRQIWQEQAHIGGLTALRARSRVGESEALSDPGGLGAFRVLEWLV